MLRRIKYNLLQIYYTDGKPTSKSAVRIDIEQNEDAKILFDLGGERVDEWTRRTVLDQDPEFQNLNYEGIELFIADPACMDYDFLKEPNFNALVELVQNVTAGNMCQLSNIRFGRTEHLVIVKRLYLTKPSPADIYDTPLLSPSFNPRYHS